MTAGMRHTFAGFRVYDKDSFALIQLVKNRIKRFVPQVYAISVGEDGEPDDTECVQSVVNFGYGAWDSG